MEVLDILGDHIDGGQVGAAAKPPLPGDAVPLVRLKVPARGEGRVAGGKGGGSISGMPGPGGAQVRRAAAAAVGRGSRQLQGRQLLEAVGDRRRARL
jgi:hypothetical protein